MSIYFDRSEELVNVNDLEEDLGDTMDDPQSNGDEKEELIPPSSDDSEVLQSQGVESDAGKRAYLSVCVLFFVNLLNYMDRFTVAGNLEKIQDYYSLDDAEGGLLQTVFIIMYMIAAPLFGFLGDRYNRKFLMCLGISLWSIFTMVGSFIPNHLAPLFFLDRGLVGIGEASYSTIAPTIIADLFSKGQRTRMLAVFYFAIPVGSGMGYVLGTYVGQAAGAWQWGLRVTPFLGVIAVALIALVVKEPKRGASDTTAPVRNTTYIQDLTALFKTPSYVWSCFGYVGVAWVAGCLSWWAPKFIQNAYRLRGQSGESVALIFGGITVATGVLGVALGAESARRWKKTNPRADPLVCAIGLIGCMPFLYFVITLAHRQEILSWILIFFGETFLSLNWAVTADILLYVVIPTRRSTANALQMLLSHLLGDATSPYIVGQLSDIFHKGNDSAMQEFTALQFALYLNCFIAVLGGACFLVVSFYVVEDKAKAAEETKDLGETRVINVQQVNVVSEVDVSDSSGHAVIA
ncbi:protein spinster homolog 1-like [Glandiceps talaboti]